MDREIVHGTLVRGGWAVLGIMFFVPMAVGFWFESPALYPGHDPRVWPAVALALGLGCIVGVVFPLRKRVMGLPGIALRVVLFTVIVFGGVFWAALIKIAIETRR
jgi:hypothetical protein